MKVGKISENVLKRSILKYIQPNSEKMIRGAGVGVDCALFPPFDCAQTVTLSLPVAGDILIRHAVYAAAGSVAAGGGLPKTVLLNLTLPEKAREIRLQEMMQAASEVCHELGLEIAGGHTEVSDAVNRSVVSVTACGTYASVLPVSGKPDWGNEKNTYSGYDIVVTKYIAAETAALLASAREEQLRARFPAAMLEEVKGYESYSLSVLPEAATAMKSGICLMHDIREGGIFGALWEMAQGAGVGLTIDLKKIPMKQSIVEICNYYDLNPYESMSTGCLLAAVPDGEAFAGTLAEASIPAAVIGKLTESNDRIVKNGEETRYLDLPKPDQIRNLLRD